MTFSTDGAPVFSAASTVGLSRARRPPAPAGVRGDDHPGLGVVTAVDDGVGREAAEDDRVGDTDAGAGQHGDRQLEDHRHVDGDPVALLQALVLEDVGELADLGQQLGVGDRDRVARLALPVVGDLVTPAGLDVAVEAVGGDVELAADEPLGEREVPFEGRLEVLVPGDELPAWRAQKAS